MLNLTHTKLLVFALLLLATIAGSLAYSNAKQAQKEAEAARSRAALQQAMKTSANNWGGSANTIRTYRPK
jgi:type II secretory pathway pseudopilin PulG